MSAEASPRSQPDALEVGDGHAEGTRPARRWVAAGIVVGLAIGAGGWVSATSGPGATGEARTQSTPTAIAESRNLVSHETVSGTLGFDDSRAVLGGLAGSVTWVAEEGTTVRRGGTLYRVDDVPVVLMYGSTPAWRPLEAGVTDGRDVRQLEANLAALGFGDDLTVDTTWTSATTEAVQDWQAARGLEDTGSIELGRVVFLPGKRRVGSVQVDAGSPAQGVIMQATSTRRIVNIALDASLQDLARAGQRVDVTLPDQSEVSGTITEVGRVAEISSDETESTATIDVTVRIENRDSIRRFDQAPVNVDLIKEQEKDTLAVPVTALLALAEGGFGVELQTDSGTEVVAVTPGLYSDDGWVEVDGGIRPGDRVVVPE